MAAQAGGRGEEGRDLGWVAVCLALPATLTRPGGEGGLPGQLLWLRRLLATEGEAEAAAAAAACSSTSSSGSDDSAGDGGDDSQDEDYDATCWTLVRRR